MTTPIDPEIRDRAWARWVENFPTDADLPRIHQDMLLDTLQGRGMVLAVLASDMAEPARTALGAMADQLDAVLREARRKTFEWWGL